MHPLNPYAFRPPNFALLASKSEKLRRLVHKVEGVNDGIDESSRIDVDFHDADSSIAVTEAILEHDFGLHVALRRDRLCPPIPNRLNYLAWLQELMNETQRIAQCISSSSEIVEEGEKSNILNDERPAKRIKKNDEPIRVLDIGTGASCIYPILGYALNEWSFIATDVDPESIDAARVIVNDPRNNGTSLGRFTKGKRMELQSRICLCLRDSQDQVLLSKEDLDTLNLERIKWPRLQEGLLYHVAMCNPPFYSSQEEIRDSAEVKAKGPRAVCLGSEIEMICPGGEVAFVTRMIEESSKLKDQVLWFTSMIGKWSSVRIIAERLSKEKPATILVTEFNQGKTKRWAIAWTYQPYRIDTSQLLSRQDYRFLRVVPKPNACYTRQIDLTLPSTMTIEERTFHLLKHLDYNSISWTYNQEDDIVVLASSKSWSRAARRARQREKEQQTNITVQHTSRVEDETLILCVRLTIKSDTLTSSWLYGHDQKLYESFFSSILQEWAKALAAVSSSSVP